MNKLLFSIFIYFLFCGNLLSQTTRENIEKDKIENYIDKGTSPFSIKDYVTIETDAVGEVPLLLNVINSSTAGYLNVKDATQGGDVRFGISSGSDNDAIVGTWTANNIDIYTNSSQKMIIESGGDVGIGTTDPDEKLEVGGEIKAQNYYSGRQLINSSTATLTFNSSIETGVPQNAIAQISVYVLVNTSNYAVAHWQVINGGSTSISYQTTPNYHNVGSVSLASATYSWSGSYSYPRINLTSSSAVDVVCIVTLLGAY